MIARSKIFIYRFLHLEFYAVIISTCFIYFSIGTAQPVAQPNYRAQEEDVAVSLRASDDQRLLNNESPDESPPYTEGHIPKKFSSNIPIRQPIRLLVKDDFSGVNPDSIKMWINDKLVEPQLTQQGKNVLVEFDSLWNYNDSIHVSISAQDLAVPANEMKPDSYYFKIKTDFDPPILFDRLPVEGVYNVRRDTPIRFRLEDQPAGVDSNSIQFFINGEALNDFIIRGDSSLYTIIYEPKALFQFNDRIRVKVIATDLVSPPNQMEEAWEFFTVSYYDTIPPYTTNHQPFKFFTNVALNSEVSVDIVDDSRGVARDSIHLFINGELVVPQITGTPAKYTVRYQKPGGFQYNDSIHVRIQAADLNDEPNRMKDDVYYFKTLVDQKEPVVIDLIPRNGATDVPANSPIQFCIQDELAGVNIESIRLYVNNQLVTPEITGDRSKYCIRYVSGTPFRQGEVVHGRIEAEDLSNPVNVMLPLSFRFVIEDNLPDLVIREFYTIPDKDIYMNSPLQLCLKMASEHTSTVEPFYVSFLQDNLPVGNRDTLIAGLPADSIFTLKAMTRVSLGTHYLKVILDSQEDVVEAEEINNIAELVIQVGEGEFSVRPNPFTPNNDGINDQAKFKVNQLDLQTPVLRLFTFEQKNFLTIEQAASHEFLWNGKDAAGNEMPPGIYLYLLEDGKKVVAKGYIVLAR